MRRRRAARCRFSSGVWNRFVERTIPLVVFLVENHFRAEKPLGHKVEERGCVREG